MFQVQVLYGQLIGTDYFLFVCHKILNIVAASLVEFINIANWEFRFSWVFKVVFVIWLFVQLFLDSLLCYILLILGQFWKVGKRHCERVVKDWNIVNGTKKVREELVQRKFFVILELTLVPFVEAFTIHVRSRQSRDGMSKASVFSPSITHIIIQNIR